MEFGLNENFSQFIFAILKIRHLNRKISYKIVQNRTFSVGIIIEKYITKTIINSFGMIMLSEQNLKAAYRYYNQACESQRNGDYLTAIQNYRLSIINFPTIEAYIHLSSALSKHGRYEEAIEKCLSALRIDSKEYSAYNYIGYYFIKMKKYNSAKVWLDFALSFDSNKSKHFTYFNLGIIHEKRGEWYQAIEMFDNAIKIKSDFHKAEKKLILLTAKLN